MASVADRGMIETFVQKSARPIYNYRMARGASQLTKQKKAEQELHDAIMHYAMTYAVHHGLEAK